VADVRERPARLDPHVDVHASPSRGLREAGVAEVAEEDAGLGRDPHGVCEVRPGLRVQVEPQLVRVIDVLAAHGPGMKGDRAHLGRPAHYGHLGGADLVRVPAGGELDARRLQVVRRATRDPLLKERVAAALLARGEDDARVHALGPALERGGPAVEGAHDAVLDRQVVPHDVELRDRPGALRLRENHAIGARDAQVAPTRFDDGCVGGGHA
jgi:hypothetical protein